jgi:predicted AAA+ superfamily ATPase
MKNVTESLAGRIAILSLQGLSQSEKNMHPECLPFLPSFELRKNTSALSLEETYKLIWKGSYPRLLAESTMDWELFYDSYVSAYLEKDVRTLVNVDQEHNFLKFLRVVAARTGQLLSYSNIASDIGISVNTAKSWIPIIAAMFLILSLSFGPLSNIKRTSKDFIKYKEIKWGIKLSGRF